MEKLDQLKVKKGGRYEETSSESDEIDIDEVEWKDYMSSLNNKKNT